MGPRSTSRSGWALRIRWVGSLVRVVTTACCLTLTLSLSQNLEPDLHPDPYNPDPGSNPNPNQVTTACFLGGDLAALSNHAVGFLGCSTLLQQRSAYEREGPTKQQTRYALYAQLSSTRERKKVGRYLRKEAPDCSPRTQPAPPHTQSSATLCNRPATLCTQPEALRNPACRPGLQPHAPSLRSRAPQASRLPPILDAVLHAWRSLGGFGSAASPDSPSWQQQRRPPAARGALAFALMHGGP